MPGAAVVNVSIASGNILVSGAESVIVNNHPLGYLSSVNSKGVAVVAGSTSVKAENKQAARVSDAMSNGSVIATGSLDVFIGSDVESTTPVSQAMTNGDETDAEEPGTGAKYIESVKSAGIFTTRDLGGLAREQAAAAFRQSERAAAEADRVVQEQIAAEQAEAARIAFFAAEAARQEKERAEATQRVAQQAVKQAARLSRLAQEQAKAAYRQAERVAAEAQAVAQTRAAASQLAAAKATAARLAAQQAAQRVANTKPPTPVPPKAQGPVNTNCGNLHDQIDNYPGILIDRLPLTSNFTLGSITRAPTVTFDHPVRPGGTMLGFEQTLCNLKLLAINCIEPIKIKFPNLHITNSWRPAGIGSPTSQHPKGQAFDMQFRGVHPKDYFTICQWIRDNVAYDQLLLEYKTVGTRLPWIHLSFDSAKSRRQVLTLLNNVTYAQGLTQLA